MVNLFVKPLVVEIASIDEWDGRDDKKDVGE